MRTSTFAFFEPELNHRLLDQLKERWYEHLLNLLDKLPALLAIALVAFILMRIVIFLTNRLRSLSLKSQIASSVRAS